MGAQRRQRRPVAVGWKALSPPVRALTLYVTVLTSVAIPVFELFQYPVIGNTILAALLAGAVGGVGFRMLFRVGASSGGRTSMSWWPGSAGGAWISGRCPFLYQRGYPFASFVVVDIEKIPAGRAVAVRGDGDHRQGIEIWPDRRAQVLIISKRTQDIADFILNELDRSATIIPAKGRIRSAP